MKRKGLLITVMLLVAVVLVIGSKKEIIKATGKAVVAEPAYDLITGLGDTSFWAGFLGEVPASVLNLSPGQFVVSMPGNPTDMSSSVFLYVAPLRADSSVVTWVRKVSLIDWVREKTGSNGPVSTALVRLKVYAEDPGRRYGFPMKMVPVTTRFFLTLRDSIRQAAGGVLPRLDSALNDYARKRQLHFDSPAWFVSLLALANGETRLALGRSLPEPVKTEPPFICYQLPGNGRLLEVDFTGDLNQFSRCEAAAGKYILSQHLKTVAQPLQQYERLPLTAADSSSVTMKYFLPVY